MSYYHGIPADLRKQLKRLKRRQRDRRGHHSYWMARGYAALLFDPYQRGEPVDKTPWGPGPWETEPDRAFWQHSSGLLCAVLRADVTGSWCGYVRLPKGHPWRRAAWDRMDVEVHGGITFAETLGAYRWIGFDCAHAWDDMPALRARLSSFTGTIVHDDPPHAVISPAEFGASFLGIYRDLSYAILETDRLAEQVSQAQ